MSEAKLTGKKLAMTVCLEQHRISLAVINQDLVVVRQATHEVALRRGPEVVLAVLRSYIQELLAVTNNASDYAGIGVAFPGIVDSTTGIVKYSFGDGWDDVQLREVIEKAIDLPALVESSGNASTFGESTCLDADVPDYDNIVGFFVGETVLGGIISNGQLYRGRGGGAAQFGHVIVADVKGRRCRCGKDGHLEAYISSGSLIDQARRQLESGIDSQISEFAQGNLDQISISEIRRAAALGDSVAAGLMEETANYIAKAVSTVVELIGPSVVVLGGSVIEESREVLLDLIGARLTTAGSLIAPLRGPYEPEAFLVTAKLGPMACAVGLAAMLFGDS